MSTEVVVVAAARTPQGRLLGQLAPLTAAELGAAVIHAVMERSAVTASDVDYVIMGQVLQAGAGQNPARQASIRAGLPWSTPAVTLNKVCLSGLTAVIDAARMIRCGDASVVIAGGQESMTNAPHLLPGSRGGWKYGAVSAVDSAAVDGLTDAFDNESMGLSTEKYNAALSISRAEQDSIAALSHQRAAGARDSGHFSEEIVPVEVPGRRGAVVTVSDDEGVRAESTVESLAKLHPAFDRDGAITAGNSSPLSDGASALVLTSREYAVKHDLRVLAVVGSAGQVAGPDNSLHSQPANAIAAALASAGWSASDLDFIEINEAFASVVVQSTRDLGVSSERVNIHGGAIALGHPIGASGARLAVHTVHELSRRGGGRAAVALCGGGGQGEALLFSL